MANLNIHPAPGLGDLMAGYFVVPQDPITMAAQGISVKPKLGDFVAGSFVVPQNPLWGQITGTTAPIGQGAAGTPMVKKSCNTRATTQGQIGGGCGCGGACGGHGLGDISADLSTFSADLTAGNFSKALTQDTIMGLPVYLVAALGFGVAYLMGGGSTGRGRRG